MEEFREIWARVANRAGEEFRLESGERFFYDFKRTFIVVTPAGISLPKTNFQKVARLGAAAAVQGRRYIRAILEDPRVAAQIPATQ